MALPLLRLCYVLEISLQASIVGKEGLSTHYIYSGLLDKRVHHKPLVWIFGHHDYEEALLGVLEKSERTSWFIRDLFFLKRKNLQ